MIERMLLAHSKHISQQQPAILKAHPLAYKLYSDTLCTLKGSTPPLPPSSTCACIHVDIRARTHTHKHVHTGLSEPQMGGVDKHLLVIYLLFVSLFLKFEISRVRIFYSQRRFVTITLCVQDVGRVPEHP